jgi:hypothetical protein
MKANHPVVGAGYTVEGQKTGKENKGGLQIEVTTAYETGLRIWTSDDRSTGVTTEGFLSSFGLPSLDENKSLIDLGYKPGQKVLCLPPWSSHMVPTNVVDIAGSNCEVTLSVSRLALLSEGDI